MENKSLKPKIRFKGFTEAWEQRKLSEIATMYARIGWQNLRKNEFLDSGKYLLITGTDFENGEINYSTCHYVEKERYIKDKNIQVENGSILITKDGTLGKVALVRKLPIPATLNAGVFNVKNNKILSDNKYVFQYLKAPFLMNYVLQNATGGTIKHLNQNILVDFIVKMPNIDEQRKIGELLDCIDNLITLHQRKCDKLLNIKKSLLEKMFPKNGNNVPEIRFKGFTEAWEQRKVTDVGKIFIGLVTTMTKNYTDVGTLLIRNSDIKDNHFEFDSNPIHLDEGFAKSNDSRRMHIGDVVTVHTGDVGTSAVITEKEDGSIGFATIVTRPNKEIIDSNYLSTYLNTEQHKNWAINQSTGDGRTNYNLKEFTQLIVPLPSLKEQQCISKYIKQIDNLITLHQKKLNKLKNIKKSLLEKMFV